jgi:hypothetical protein
LAIFRYEKAGKLTVYTQEVRKGVETYERNSPEQYAVGRGEIDAVSGGRGKDNGTA